MDKFVVRQKRANIESVDNAVRESGLVSKIASVEKGCACAENAENINSSLPEIVNTWKKQYPWLQANSKNKLICNICTEAYKQNLVVKFDARSLFSKKAWVDEGFTNFKHGAERIKSHSSSVSHINCAEALKNEASTNVVQQLSSSNLKQMMDSRTALRKIFSTLLALAKQGLPLRGDNNDENSNFLAILKARAEDVPELNSWFKREGHKWIHHSSQNEILDLMATTILSQIMDKIREAEYFSILLDETSDITRNEQVSVCIRIVAEDLTAKEYFIGFFTTADTKAKTLFDLVTTIFAKFNLSLHKLRGQCYDGAANVSGKISGLQKRICEEEPRALFLHCNAHNLNLVVQDSIEKVSVARKFIGFI